MDPCFTRPPLPRVWLSGHVLVRGGVVVLVSSVRGGMGRCWYDAAELLLMLLLFSLAVVES